MKTTLIAILISLLLASTAIAQTVPNAGFENWHNVGGWFDNPDDWMTNNTQIMAPGVIRDSGAYQGVLAMRVANITHLPGHAYTMFQLFWPAVQSVTVYVKSNILPGDTTSIQLYSWKSGAVKDTAIWFNTYSVPSWNSITIPFSSEDIDSLSIDVYAGKQAGTWLSADEFTIQIPEGVGIYSNNSGFTLFPNPMTASSTLRFLHPVHGAATLYIYDCTGRIISTIPGITQPEINIPKGSLAKGIYFLQFADEEKVLLLEKLVVE